MTILASYVCRLQLFRNAQESAMGKLFLLVHGREYGNGLRSGQLGADLTNELEFQPFHIHSTDGRTIYYVESFHVFLGRKEGDKVFNCIKYLRKILPYLGRILSLIHPSWSNKCNYHFPLIIPPPRQPRTSSLTPTQKTILI